MNYELRQYSFGETIGKGFNLYFNNFTPMILVSLLCQVPQVLLLRFSSFSHIPQHHFDVSFFVLMFINTILTIIFSSFLAAFIINLVAKKFLENSPTPKENMTSIFSYILPVIGLSFLVGLAIIVSAVALVVPGIIVALGYSVATQVLIIEKRKIKESMGRSWTLTKGKRGSLFLIMLVIYIIVACINLPFTGLFHLLHLDLQLITYLNLIIGAITAPIIPCILVVIYFNLRIEKEGFNIEHLAQQFTLAEEQDSSIKA
jgi:hypothetical protein